MQRMWLIRNSLDYLVTSEIYLKPVVIQMKYILSHSCLHLFWPEQVCIVFFVNKQLLCFLTASFSHMEF